MRYAIVIEPNKSNFSAWVLDLPGCIANGATVVEVEQHIREAIEFHIEGMRAYSHSVPAPRSRVDYANVAA